MNEIWKDVPGYEGLYQVSDLGRIKSLEKTTIGMCRWSGEKTRKRVFPEKIIKVQTCKHNGYSIVTLHKDFKQKTYRFHRIIASVFIENPLNKTQVNHIDGDKSNNSASNLEWVTGRENMQHAIDVGLVYQGEKHNSSKLNANKIKDIRRMKEEGIMAMTEMAKMYNVSERTIQSICYRKSWKHIK